MIVGQDFNSEIVYKNAFDRGAEVGISPAWREFPEILHATHISLNQCFFTNLYMELRAKGRSEKGALFPGGKGEKVTAFEGRCLTFFKQQLEMVRPKLILVLGLEPFKVLAAKLVSSARAKGSI